MRTLEHNKVKHDLDMAIVEWNKRSAKLEEEIMMLKSTLKSKVVSIENLQQESKQVLFEKKTLEDKYLVEIVVLTNANKVATNVLKGFQMPTHTILMLSKRPNFASHDLHKTGLGYSNPRYGKQARIAQPALLKSFIPQKELSREQVYWLPAAEIASQSSTLAKPVATFVHTRPVKSDVHKKVWKIKECITAFEKIIKERTAPPPSILSSHRLWHHTKECFDEQITPFFNNIKQLFQTLDTNIFQEVKEFERTFDELDAEYERILLEKKNM
nr:hypothetical protein [Tanacetum cinerariifolium]